MTPPAAVPAGVRFTGNSIGEGIRGEERPQIAHVAVADLDRDGLPAVIVCDATRNQVTWIRQAPRGTYAETLVANVPAPAHVEVIDLHAGDAESAERVLLETTRAQRQSGRAHVRLGALYQGQRREAEALQAFEAAAAAGPLAAAGRLQVTIGRLRENQLDPAGADEAFRRAPADRSQ